MPGLSPTIARSAASVQSAGPLIFAFQYASTPEMIQDFLELPVAGEGKASIARIRYQDRSGKPRIYDWKFGTEAPLTPFALPDGDIVVTSATERTIPSKLTLEGSTIDLSSRVGGRTADLVVFKIKRGSGAGSESIRVLDVACRDRSARARGTR